MNVLGGGRFPHMKVKVILNFEAEHQAPGHPPPLKVPQCFFCYCYFHTYLFWNVLVGNVTSQSLLLHHHLFSKLVATYRGRKMWWHQCCSLHQYIVNEGCRGDAPVRPSHPAIPIESPVFKVKWYWVLFKKSEDIVWPKQGENLLVSNAAQSAFFKSLLHLFKKKCNITYCRNQKEKNSIGCLGYKIKLGNIFKCFCSWLLDSKLSIGSLVLLYCYWKIPCCL